MSVKVFRKDFITLRNQIQYSNLPQGTQDRQAPKAATDEAARDLVGKRTMAKLNEV
jgi:hypothetical protein